MSSRAETRVLTDGQWNKLAPLIERCRPPHKTEHHNLRRTIAAIIWRHKKGAPWRDIPVELAQEQGGVELGMAFLDGTSIRAHHKAAGAAKKGEALPGSTNARRWAARAEASAPRPA